MRSSWFTSARVRRLDVVLRVVPSKAPGIPSDSAGRRIWQECGGPFDEVPVLVQALIAAGLCVVTHGQILRTRSGNRAAGGRKSEGLRPVAEALLRAGLFHDQARKLLEQGSPTPDGGLQLPVRYARREVPQLLGILQHWADVEVQPIVLVPRSLLAELEAVWALLPPPVTDSAADAIRKTIGNRGELYSYQLERLRAEQPSNIVWVSRDDDRLGYDIEDRGENPRRRIEVKASGDDVVRFFMSDNEWRRAHEDPDRFEVQFWGGVDLGTEPADEFSRLCDAGFPIVFKNLPELLGSGQLAAAPVKWRIATPTERPSSDSSATASATALA